MLRVYLKNYCLYDIFRKSFRIKHLLLNYLKKSRYQSLDENFPFQRTLFGSTFITKIVMSYLVASGTEYMGENVYLTHLFLGKNKLTYSLMFCCAKRLFPAPVFTMIHIWIIFVFMFLFASSPVYAFHCGHCTSTANTFMLRALLERCWLALWYFKN